MSVTASAASERPRSSRNAAILAEWKPPKPLAEESEALRNLIVALTGEMTDEEREARSLAAHLNASAFYCSGCKREVDVGQTVYRVHRGRRFKAFCLTCVCGWHPSWMRAAKKPALCEGGCGVFVTSPYRDVYRWHNSPGGVVEEWVRFARYCSERCRRRAENLRRSPRAELTCTVCGDPFTPKRSDARYCSSACRQDAYRRRKDRAVPFGQGSGSGNRVTIVPERS